MKPLVKVKNSWKLSREFIEELKALNSKKSKHQITDVYYAKELQKLCDIKYCISINKDYLHFLGGFILGEESLYLSLKKKTELKYGVALDLEFSVTQSFFGVDKLINLLFVFKTGRLHYKSGSNATLVFTISNRKSIFKKVLPFWKKYIFPFITVFERKRFEDFQKIEELFESKAHLNKKDIVEKLLPLWEKLRKQKGQKNQTFESLENAIEYINKKTVS